MPNTEINTIKELQALQNACSISMVALVKDIIELEDRIRVTISDGTDIFFFTVWNSQQGCEFAESVFPGYIYQFLFYVDNKGKGSYIKSVTAWASITETEELSRRFKTLTFNRLSETNKADFISGIRILTNPSFKRLVEVAYGVGKVPEGINTKDYRERLTNVMKAWGSINRHDSYPGGYINHVCDMLRIARKLQELYSDPFKIGRLEKSCDVDWDYLFTIIYLHDIGKSETYEETSGGTIRWRATTKISHNDIGMASVVRLLNEMEPSLRPDYETSQKILYGVQQHGNLAQFTVKDKVLTVEDKLLTLIDCTDAMLVSTLIL